MFLMCVPPGSSLAWKFWAIANILDEANWWWCRVCVTSLMKLAVILQALMSNQREYLLWFLVASLMAFVCSLEMFMASKTRFDFSSRSSKSSLQSSLSYSPVSGFGSSMLSAFGKYLMLYGGIRDRIAGWVFEAFRDSKNFLISACDGT